MCPWRRLAMYVLAPMWVVSVPVAPALAQEAGVGPDDGAEVEGIDDPKLSRRLGTRLAGPPEAAASMVSPAAPDAPGAPPVAEAEGELEAEGAQGAKQPLTPRLKVAYRRFVFAQVATPGMTSPAASEAFNVVSLDFYPISSTWRFGLTSQYGWQEGTFRKNGDAFFSAVTSLGWQIPGPAITPFFEGYAGGGLMQRTKGDLGLNSIATAFGELGADLGFEAFLAQHLCLSFAAGYVHLTNGYARQGFETFAVDTWSFKVGLGF